MIVYYRRLIKHAGSFVVCVPRAIIDTWKGRRGHYVRFILHDNRTVTLEHVKEGPHAQDPLQADPPGSHPAATDPAPRVYGQ